MKILLTILLIAASVAVKAQQKQIYPRYPNIPAPFSDAFFQTRDDFTKQIGDLGTQVADLQDQLKNLQSLMQQQAKDYQKHVQDITKFITDNSWSVSFEDGLKTVYDSTKHAMRVSVSNTGSKTNIIQQNPTIGVIISNDETVNTMFGTWKKSDFMFPASNKN